MSQARRKPASKTAPAAAAAAPTPKTKKARASDDVALPDLSLGFDANEQEFAKAALELEQELNRAQADFNFAVRAFNV